jgi:hypothetical protein
LDIFPPTEKSETPKNQSPTLRQFFLPCPSSVKTTGISECPKIRFVESLHFYSIYYAHLCYNEVGVLWALHLLIGAQGNRGPRAPYGFILLRPSRLQTML